MEERGCFLPLKKKRLKTRESFGWEEKRALVKKKTKKKKSTKKGREKRKGGISFF